MDIFLKDRLQCSTLGAEVDSFKLACPYQFPVSASGQF